MIMAIALGMLWSILRELHIHAMQRSQEQAAAKLVEHLGSINKLLESSGRAIEQVSKEVLESGQLTREKRAEMIAYFRDIELRIIAAVHDNRDWVRDYLARIGHTIHNHNSIDGHKRTQFDINGNVNQAGGEINNE